MVAYASRKHSDTECHYHSNMLERLAVVWSVDDKFRHYLFGHKFIVVTDNAVKAWMFLKQKIKQTFAWKIITLQEYNFDVRHCTGGLSNVTNALSRNPFDCAQQTRQNHIFFAQMDIS